MLQAIPFVLKELLPMVLSMAAGSMGGGDKEGGGGSGGILGNIFGGGGAGGGSGSGQGQGDGMITLPSKTPSASIPYPGAMGNYNDIVKRVIAKNRRM